VYSVNSVVKDSGFGLKTHKLSWTDWLIVLIATPLMHLLGLTLRIKSEGRADLGPRGKQDQPPLWPLWHETILMSVWYHRDRDVHVMISASRDGELITTIGKFFGYTAVRGSSSKGGQEATREMVDYLKQGKRCAITPDGPRGPRRQMKMGAVQIARVTGCPVVPFGFAAEHCWRLRSWDRFIIPKPFSRAVFVYGEPIRIPNEGGNDEEYMKTIQKELDRVTEAAENCFGKKI
jgi:lysophospholipid acyltransferase (LPLAT)-like uncharacterized protein